MQITQGRIKFLAEDKLGEMSIKKLFHKWKTGILYIFRDE